jgi:hypothetical protein
MDGQDRQATHKEVRVSAFIRQFHRWVSAIFVLSVIATTIVLTQPKPLIWFSYVPLFPLSLLTLSGVFLFLRPYISRTRAEG